MSLKIERYTKDKIPDVLDFDNRLREEEGCDNGKSEIDDYRKQVQVRVL